MQLLQRRQQLHATEVLDDERLACELVKGLVEERSTNEALENLQLLTPTRRVLQTAAAAFGAKGSFRGVAAVHQKATKLRLLRGKASADLWFAFVAAYGALGRLTEVRNAFKGARAAGAWLPADTWHTNVYLHALIDSDASLVFIRARQLLQEGAVADASTYNTLLKACMRGKDSRRADLVLEWMAAGGVAPDAVTYSSLIKAHSYAGNFEGVLSVRDAMAAAGFLPTASVWGSLLVACGAAQHHETALMVWREARAVAAATGQALPTSVCNAMMTACTACLQFERAIAVLAEMKAAGPAPNVVTYNLAIKACGGQPGQRVRQQQLQMAVRMYGEMQQQGLQPDGFTFGTLLELCAEARDGATAALLHQEMEGHGVKPNGIVMASLFKALARAGMVEECMHAFSRTVWGPARVKPTRSTFKILIRELRQAGALAQALAVYEGMRRARHAPNNREFQDLIAAAAEAALAHGDPELQARVASLCGVTYPGEIDLHGMSTHEARAAVLCTLGMALAEYLRSGGAPPPMLTLITGRGVHSPGGVPALQDAARRLLREELHLQVGEDVRGNAGRIVVESEELARWLRSRAAARGSSGDAQSGEGGKEERSGEPAAAVPSPPE